MSTRTETHGTRQIFTNKIKEREEKGHEKKTIKMNRYNFQKNQHAEQETAPFATIQRRQDNTMNMIAPN